MVKEDFTKLNPNEVSANKIVAHIDGIVKSEYILEKSETIVDEHNKIFEYFAEVEKNPILQEKLSNYLNAFITKHWTKASVTKAANDAEKESFVKMLPEIRKQKKNDDQRYINNFLAAFLGINPAENIGLDIVDPDDFKGLDLSKKDLAKIFLLGYNHSIRAKGGLFRLLEKDPSLVEKFEQYNKKFADEKMYQVLVEVFDRLVVEYGYNPTNLAS